MNITPLRAMVLVDLEDLAPTNVGGIELVKFDRQPSTYARVRAVGPEVRDARVGTRVVVSRLQGIEVAGSVLLPESAVLAQASDAQADGDATE